MYWHTQLPNPSSVEFMTPISSLICMFYRSSSVLVILRMRDGRERPGKGTREILKVGRRQQNLGHTSQHKRSERQQVREGKISQVNVTNKPQIQVANLPPTNFTSIYNL